MEGKMDDEQQLVDSYAEAIKSAISMLEEKPADEKSVDGAPSSQQE